MSLPGRLLLKFNQYRALGLKAAWYRDVVRPRILRSPPCVGLTDFQAEIHVMTSADDWLNLIWALKSFYAASKCNYALCIHDDGTLPPEALAQLRHHFQPLRIILRHQADAEMMAALEPYPLLKEFRRTNVFGIKLTDYAFYSVADRFLMMDSDILFFKEPTALLQGFESPGSSFNMFNSDYANSYVVTPEMAWAHCQVELKPLINAGLGVIQRSSVRHDWLEEFLGMPGILEGHFWRIEQQLVALYSSRFGVALLPDEYTVDISHGETGDRPCRHYVGCIRSRMYSEGMARLAKEGLLQ